MTFVLGLTGSIAMGKSTTANFFREFGVPVFDADATVHDLYRGKAVPVLKAYFPDVIDKGVVDRSRLAAQIVNNPEQLALLGRLIHPLVRYEEQQIRTNWVEQGVRLGVIDIPLLLENKGDYPCQAVVVVSAPVDVQRQRVLSRAGMNEEKYNALLKKQMPDLDKRKQAHFIIETGRGFEAARQQVKDLLRCLAFCI